MKDSDRLHRALAQWHDWGLNDGGSPSSIRRMPGGLTNQNFSLHCGRHHLVLRLNNTDDQRLNILRPVELTIQRYMAHIGFSPKVHYMSPEEGYWVRDYVAGQVLETSSLTPESLAGMARLLHSVHHLDISQLKIPPLDFATKANRYLSLLRSEYPHYGALLDDCADAIRHNNNAMPEGQVLCHMDPLPANWIRQPSGLLSLIDWEYAAVAHPLLDFAAVYRALPEHLRPQWLNIANVGREDCWHAALRQVEALELLWLVAEKQTSIESLQTILRHEKV